MYNLPVSVTIGDEEFSIRNNGDYRMVLDCFSALEDVDLAPQERLCAALIIFYNNVHDIDELDKLGDIQEAVKQMYNFFNCNRPEGVGKTSHHKLIDWESDSQLICSAVNKVANTEVRALPYLHWWTFMGYYSAIGECPLNTIIGIRNKLMKGKKLEKFEKEFKRENPEYFVWNSTSVEATEADKLARELWNSEVK